MEQEITEVRDHLNQAIAILDKIGTGRVAKAQPSIQERFAQKAEEMS